jgi:hypothetical protein
MAGKPLDSYWEMPTIAVGGFLFPEESQKRRPRAGVSVLNHETLRKITVRN